MMLWPKKDTAAYCLIGFGNRARDEMTSYAEYKHVLLPKKLLPVTHFYGCRIGDVHSCTDIWI